MATEDPWKRLRRLKRELDEIEQELGGCEPDDGQDDDEDWTLFRAFLDDHPEIAGARICRRDDVIFESVNPSLDPVLDREYVSWPWRSEGVAVSVFTSVKPEQVLSALARATRKLSRAATAAEVGRELWGPDALARHSGGLARWLGRQPCVVVDRSPGTPNHYSVAA